MLFVSSAEARSLEAERRQKAEAAVRALQDAETKAVADALATLDVNDSNASSMTVATEFGPLEIVALGTQVSTYPRILHSTRASVEVIADTVAEVLASVAQESDDGLLLTVVAMNEASSSNFAVDAVLGEASALSSPAVSINFWRKDGTRFEVKNLLHPLRFNIESSDPAARCAFWDEDISRWSDEGTSTVVNNGTIQCITSHLTIFGGIKDVLLRNIVLALTCSTISSLFSSDAFSKLQNTAWLTEAPAILNITFHLLGVLFVVLAWLYDCKLERVVPWEERELVLMQVREEDEEDEEEKRASDAPRPTFWTQGGESTRPSCWSRCMGCFNSSLEYVSHATGGDAAVETLKEVAGNADTAAVNRAISSIQSQKTWTSRSQIRVFKQTKAVKGDSKSLSHGATKTWSNFAAESDDQGEAAARAFLERGWVCRIATLWPASHPWMTATYFSMLAPIRVSVALLFLKVTSAGALSAVFFSSGSPSPDADPECTPPSGGIAKAVQSLTVGLVTAMLGDVIISILFALQTKKVVFSPSEWSEEQKGRQYTYWRLWSVLFWLVFLLYGGFCQLYICLFLANVTKADAGSWLQSMGVSLLEGLLLKSLLTALILATIATVVLRCRPHVTKKIEERWISQVREMEDQELGVQRPESPENPVVEDRAVKAKEDYHGVLPGAIMASSED